MKLRERLHQFLDTLANVVEQAKPLSRFLRPISVPAPKQTGLRYTWHVETWPWPVDEIGAAVNRARAEIDPLRSRLEKIWAELAPELSRAIGKLESEGAWEAAVLQSIEKQFGGVIADMLPRFLNALDVMAAMRAIPPAGVRWGQLGNLLAALTAPGDSHHGLKDLLLRVELKLERMERAELARGGGPAVEPRRPEVPVTRPSEEAASPENRFAVAFSFPGEKRDYVKAVDECLTKSLPKESVFYDERFPGREIGHLNLDTRLQNIYYEGAELVVVFLCAETNTKQWCGVELRAVHARMKEGGCKDVMIVRFDDTKVDGFFSIDGYIDARKYGPDKAAEFILEKLEDNRAAPKA